MFITVSGIARSTHMRL